VTLANPIMTASGTAGLGTELGAYLDLSELGAVVVKSLAPFEWAGNPAPRLHPAAQGMLNSVGLQGPGVTAWLDGGLRDLVRCGATVVASIWGRTGEDFALAAEQLQRAGDAIVAIEVNLSCPNVEHRDSIFAHDPDVSADVIAAVVAAAGGRPIWAKLSPNTDRLVAVAEAVRAGGAEAVTLINTVLGRLLDPATGTPVLGQGSGGLSGRAIHPIAVRAVFDVHQAMPDLPIIGVGGVSNGWDAAELLLSGAMAVQVGTAIFADPVAPRRVLHELLDWSHARGLSDLRNVATSAG
jgi:dihydroorotate dehydrogenase (NAD+) catalytic subunit